MNNHDHSRAIAFDLHSIMMACKVLATSIVSKREKKDK